MRVAVVGASGNVGTAVLRALAEEDAVTSVVGIARRPPEPTREPYRGIEWRSVDLAVRSGVVDALTEAFEGADAVIHLVWAIQPNTDRDYLRRVNVDGTERVARAAVRAGVAHLVVASSLAVYSPVEDDVPRDESAAHGGIRSSHYSVDKVAQERLLDEFEAAANLSITRIRPALIFQGDAGAQIVRYFLGPNFPMALLRPGALPTVPLPKGLRVQVVHADDIGRAYATVVVQRAAGAFNVAAADTLWPRDLARILDHGRHVELPPEVIRPLIHYGWRARMIAADAGWLDMAMGAPVMDTSRIRGLGWTEQHSAEDTLREVLVGMRGARGMPSPSLRPYDTRFGGPIESLTPRPTDRAADRGFLMLPPDGLAARVPDHVDAELLGLYLSDHLTGATAGRARIQRMAHAFAETPMGPDLADISDQITRERELLSELIQLLGLRRRPYRQAGAWVAERVGRLKLNERIVSPSPMTPLLEVELMRSAVIGKEGVWQTLESLALDLKMRPSVFADLAADARKQQTVLSNLHAHLRPDTFAAEPEEVSDPDSEARTPDRR
ncbi:NAD-dependent epimerase/dehydratase family protein [Occultella aeris]|uniref:NAD dependent epimerase/dehydratase family protein n=1 Tax=Occultella aeris TaxID=2761496 RepID=A0A7M4DNI4_9MICO|nr:NAD-dependent epimerase/dehydratase family protein [Occultella aeris]VZO39014.1 NAD dependent epimerase/dehydratase family protein [Occultella aeris]